MAESRHGQTIVVQDVGEDNKDFWELLGGNGPMKEASEVKDYKIPDKEQTKAFKVSEDGKIQITDPEPKKSQAMIMAQNYIEHWDCSKTTTVARVMEGQERKVRAWKKAFK
eukprot:11839173-Ditylum_brightwellii.AAC.1